MYTYSLFHFVIEQKPRQHIPQIKKKSMAQSRLKFLPNSGPQSHLKQMFSPQPVSEAGVRAGPHASAAL